MKLMRGMGWATTLLLFFVRTATASVAMAQPQEWPPGGVDLPADPAVHFLRLENGLRIAWQDHKRPAARCSLRLVVHVGSLDEGDDERGMAHFVEHMAFNGTRRFPGSSIWEWFRAQGLTAGLHATATTSFSRTDYRIDLSNHDAATIADGLDVLRQFADGLLFEPAEVEAEKNIIDAEERERSSPRYRTMAAMQSRLAAGTLATRRHPLGVAAERAAFTADALRSFHQRWYRADNLTLVLVGDLGAVDAEALCSAAFGSLPKMGTPPPARAVLGDPTLADPSFAIDEAGASAVEFFVQCPRIVSRSAQTAEVRRAKVLREATAEMQRRVLAMRLLQKGSPVLAIDGGLADEFDFGHDFASILVALRCAPTDYASSLAACAHVVKDLVDQGISQMLLDRVRETALADLDIQLAKATAANSPALANRLAECLGANETPVAATVLHELCRDTLAKLTPEACTQELRAAWACKQPSIVSLGPPAHGLDTAAIWAKATAEVESQLTDAAAEPKPTPPLTWPYATDPAEALPAVERVHHAALDVEDARLANGVRVLIKRTTFAPDQVLVAVGLGSGAAHLLPSERHAAVALDRVFPMAGLSRIGNGSLHRLATQHRTEVKMRIDPRRFELRGSTTATSLAFQMEWLAAACTALAIDDDDVDGTVRAHLALVTEQRDNANTLSFRFRCKLVDESMVFDLERFAAVKARHVRRLLATEWAGAPITLAIVGDVDVEQTLALVARTFGRLQKRPPPESATADTPYRAAAIALHEQHDLATPESSSVVLVVAPLDQVSAHGMMVEARLLARTLTARLNSRIREEMGASYALRVSGFEFATAFRSSALQVPIRVAPGDEARILDATLSEFEAVRTKGVTADELELARREVLNQWQAEANTNASWLTNLVGTHDLDITLDELAAAASTVKAVTVEQMARVVAVLAPERLSTLVLRSVKSK